MMREHSDILGAVFLGWGLGTFPLMLMWAPHTPFWSRAAWGALLSIFMGGLLIIRFAGEYDPD